MSYARWRDSLQQLHAVWSDPQGLHHRDQRLSRGCRQQTQRGYRPGTRRLRQSRCPAGMRRPKRASLRHAVRHDPLLRGVASALGGLDQRQGRPASPGGERRQHLRPAGGRRRAQTAPSASAAGRSRGRPRPGPARDRAPARARTSPSNSASLSPTAAGPANDVSSSSWTTTPRGAASTGSPARA